MNHNKLKLKRSITLPILIFYGLGTMIGGGFYALLGKVSHEAGIYVPIALFFSGLLAFLTSFSFAELASRYPVSAGESKYVSEAFQKPWLTSLTGWLVILTGVVSAATLAVATIGFLQDHVNVLHSLGVIILVLAMGSIAAWGIGQSVTVITIITIIEVGALVYAIIVADTTLSQVFDTLKNITPPLNAHVWHGVFSGTFLAFYAFIGFEDMVNIAEEVKNAPNTLPTAILTSVLLATFIYIVVGLVAISSVDIRILANSNTPMAEIVRDHSWYSSTGLWLVSLLTGLNGALVQIIMASRVAYGMARRENAPRWMSKINAKTQTPIYATAAIVALVLVFALFLPMKTLAKVTSFIILIVFTLVNISLIIIKQKDPNTSDSKSHYPVWIPILGASACVFILLFQAYSSIK